MTLTNFTIYKVYLLYAVVAVVVEKVVNQIELLSLHRTFYVKDTGKIFEIRILRIQLCLGVDYYSFVVFT